MLSSEAKCWKSKIDTVEW